MLLEELLVDMIAPLNVVHPLPCAFVEGMLPICLRIVVMLLTKGFSELPVLGLKSGQVVLKVLSKAEIFRLMEWLRVESWEEKQAWGWPMESCRSQNLAS